MNEFFNRIVQTLRQFLGFFLPGGLVVIAALICVRQGYVTPWLAQIERVAPYLILGTGFLLSWRFHRSRLALVILILILADRFLHYFGPGGVAGFAKAQAVFSITSILLPLNLALFYLARERGMANLRGLVKLLFILAQPLAVYFLLREYPGVFNYLQYRIANLALLDRLPLPQPALLAYGGILLIFLLGSLAYRKPVLRGFFWSLLAIAAALHAVKTGPGATFYFCIAGLIIILETAEKAPRKNGYEAETPRPSRSPSVSVPPNRAATSANPKKLSKLRIRPCTRQRKRDATALCRALFPALCIYRFCLLWQTLSRSQGSLTLT